MSVRVLVVEDDPAVARSLDRALQLEGYEVGIADAGRPALDAIAARPPDAVVLDLMLPDIDGVDVCSRMRLGGDWTPVLMLTARDAVEDRVAGLDAGADDYLVKPFSLDELLARLRALLRRHALPDAEVLHFGDLELDTSRYVAARGEREFHLTRTEMSLLELFMRNPRQVLPRELILDRVWGYDTWAMSNSLEVHMVNLRRKTESGGEERVLHTVRGVGYALRRQ